MAQYLLSVHMVEGKPSPSEAEMQAAYRDVDALNQELQRQAAWVFAGGLHPPDTAKVVRIQDGEVITTDGAFAATKEHLGGFWIIDVSDVGEALQWAAKAAGACRGPVEVRSFQDEEDGVDEEAEDGWRRFLTADDTAS